ncbi:MAG: TonB-dependent receptor [Pseudomonadota bacterium]|nr:TonB-dependent receptor [Pseudomonadota bacterium]
MPHTLNKVRLHPLAWAALAACATAAQSPTARAQTAPNTASSAELPRVEVIRVTPLPGLGVAKDQVPSNVQTINDRKLKQAHSLNLPDALASQLPSVTVNEIQGNPYQLDVNYRGFTASPLLGTPQGLSVFQDGVRINEPFGDTVNWDLIPKSALANITLLPGSNPLFGLNTLGGALSLQTKSGDTHPGTEVEMQAGSFGRRSIDLSHGQTIGESSHVFVAASAFDEDGWRDYSPSKVRQLFGKFGQRDTDYSWDLSLTAADNKLIGNGLLPSSLLRQRREGYYTLLDVTRNEMAMLNLNATARIDAGQQLAFTAYTRHTRTATRNGDLNDEFVFGVSDENTAGVEHRTHTRQRGEGLALQWTLARDNHHLTLGASHDRAHTRFEQTSAVGSLSDTRSVIPLEADQLDARIAGSSHTSSVYFTDLIDLRSNLQLTVSGRYNDTRVRTNDLGRRLADNPTDTTLDGSGTYQKFNPAAGLTWQVSPTLTAYGNLSQGNRAPSPIELGCSDPNHACVLPNALQSDPPLRQVVSRTLEAGLRGSFDGDLRWNASAFRTENKDDLLFISTGTATGYFSNFGRTLRQGIELGLSQQMAAVSWSASYSFLRATYDSRACIVAQANSTAETSPACPGTAAIEVRPGNRIPGLPKHSLKLNADWRVTPEWMLGAQLSAYSDQYVRGNENNAHKPDGVDFNGSGRIGGYALLNLTTNLQLGRGWELFAKVTNVLDRHYATAGALGENAFTGNGNELRSPVTEQFTGPSAPRAAWVGVRLRFDALGE